LDNAVECNRWSDGVNLDYTHAGKKKGVLNPGRMNDKNIIADGVIIGWQHKVNLASFNAFRQFLPAGHSDDGIQKVLE
jgi:hypothetical protein